MKKLLLILLSAVALLLVSCSDECLVHPYNNYREKCNTRIVSIEKFNSHFTLVKGGDGVIDSKLDSTYNIGMFKFPENESYSGSFPNDINFESSKTTSIAKMFFNNGNNYVLVEDILPSNDDMPGDILVKDVLINPAGANSAILRINGFIVPLNLELHTEDSQIFCDFVRDNRVLINQAIRSLSLVDSNFYGRNLSSSVSFDYSTLNIKVFTKNNELVGDVNSADIPKPTNIELQNFMKMLSEKSAVDFPVKSGELFGYVTKSGIRFVFLVSEIRKSSIHPYRERVSIIFQEIR